MPEKLLRKELCDGEHDLANTGDVGCTFGTHGCAADPNVAAAPAALGKNTRPSWLVELTFA